MPEDFTHILNAQAGALGFAHASIVAASALPDAQSALVRWLEEGRAGDMHYMEKHGRRDDPKKVLEEAKSIIVTILPYARTTDNPEQAQGIAWYARGRDYHRVVRDKLELLATQLAEAVDPNMCWRACTDTAPLLERAYAEAAGLTFIGKNSMAIAPGAGSTFFIGLLLTDLPPPQRHIPAGNEPKKTKAQCGTCTACMDACPTNAIIAPYIVDARRCISYLTIEYSGFIPLALRRSIGQHLFGCDVCQAVCPFNHPQQEPDAPLTRLRRRGAPELKAENAQPSALELLQLSASAYRRLVKGRALSRCSRQQLARNAAIAIGNHLRTISYSHADEHAQDPQSIEEAQPNTLITALLDALSSRYAMVRGHAAWALAEAMANPESRPEDKRQIQGCLKDALHREEESMAHDEIRAAQKQLGQEDEDRPDLG